MINTIAVTLSIVALAAGCSSGWLVSAVVMEHIIATHQGANHD